MPVLVSSVYTPLCDDWPTVRPPAITTPDDHGYKFIRLSGEASDHGSNPDSMAGGGAAGGEAGALTTPGWLWTGGESLTALAFPPPLVATTTPTTIKETATDPTPSRRRRYTAVDGRVEFIRRRGEGPIPAPNLSTVIPTRASTG